MNKGAASVNSAVKTNTFEPNQLQSSIRGIADVNYKICILVFYLENNCLSLVGCQGVKCTALARAAAEGRAGTTAVSLLAYGVHSVQGLHWNRQQNNKTSLIPRQSLCQMGPDFLKTLVIFCQVEDIQLIVRSYFMHSDSAVCHTELCLEAWSGL